MTEHVYIVARAGKCNGVRLDVYPDALAALRDAKITAENAGWTEQEDEPTNPGQLWMAHGDGDEDWIEVQQRAIDPPSRVNRDVIVKLDESGLARVVTRAMVKQARR